MCKTLAKIKLALESKWLVVPLFFLALVFQLLSFYTLNVIIAATILSLVLFICDDVKNIFAIIFYVSFFIGNIYSSPNWTFYGVIIGLVCLAFAYFTITKIIKKRKSGEKFKTSRIFIPLCIISVFYCLGGIFSNFSLLAFLITLGFSAVVLFFVFIASNFTKDLDEYLPFVFTIGAILASLIMFSDNVIARKSILKIFSLYQMWIGAQNINAAAVFMLIGLISCFYLGHKKKRGYLTLLLATFLAFSIFMTSCRTIIALTVPIYLFLAVYSIVKTPHKISYVITFGLILSAITMIILLDASFIESIINNLIQKSEGSRFFSGRLDIWAWCIKYFKKYPVLGFGFIAEPKENFPLGPSNIILAHNTFLQWLVSLGVIGTLAMLFFCFCKYKILFSALKKHGIFMPLIIIIIALSGLTDQAAQMDIFVYSLSIVSIVAIDDFSPFKSLFSLKKTPNNKPLKKNI